MKRNIALVLIVLISVFSVFAQSAGEIQDGTVRMAVMQGPTGFASSALDDFVTVSVLPSPNEAVAKLVNGELDMAVLPANSVATLFNKGVGIRAVAVVGEGMLSVIGTNPESATISVPGAGGTPDHMATLLYPQYEPDYSVTAPAQLAQLLIAGKSELAILPQPFVTMVLTKNSNVKVLGDVQKSWAQLTGLEQFPMSILVASSRFCEEHPDLVTLTARSYYKSIQSILADPVAAGEKIEALGIMNASMAAPAIPACALVYREGDAAKAEVEAYFNVLMDLAPSAIGGKLPAESFWF